MRDHPDLPTFNGLGYPELVRHHLVLDFRTRKFPDDIALTLRHQDAIAAWQARDRVGRAWAWDSVAL